MNKPKKSTFLLAILITTVAALILRTINIDYPSGLWFDEMVSLTAAKQQFPFGIIHWLYIKDVHLPFYFYILHLWMNLFGDGDIALRSLSVLFGVLNVPIVYLLGKEIESEKAGIIAAFFVTVNSFLIYYSQEVRFYSLLPCMASLSVLLAIKTFKQNDIKHLISLLIVNLILIFTHPVAIIFVVFEILVFGVSIFKKNKLALNKFLITQLIIPLFIFMTYLPIFIVQIQRKHEQAPFAEFHLSTIFLYITNWFSPILSGLYNNEVYYSKIPNFFYSLDFLLFILVPILIILTGIFIAARKNGLVRAIFVISFLTLITEFFLGFTGQLCLVGKYTIIVVPFLLVISTSGILSIRNKSLSWFLIITFILLNVIYIRIGECSILHIYRNDGYNIPAIILKSFNNLDKRDIIFCESGGAFLKRYTGNKYGEILPYSIYNLDKNPKIMEKISLEINEPKYIKYLTDKKILPDVQQYTNETIINKLGKNRYFVLVLSKNPLISKNNDEIVQFVQNNVSKKNYYLPYEYLGSKIINDIIKIASQKYKLVYNEYLYDWHIIIYQNK